MTGITSMAESLYKGYDKFNDQQRKEAAEIIFKSSIRLDSYYDNIINLARLSSSNQDLKITAVDLSKLLYDRLNLCRKLYIKDQETRVFTVNIADKIIANCDEYYIGQTFDNLIINAINYCKEGRIVINLKRVDCGIEFIVTDEGIGIPKEEIYDIFNAFMISSKTKNASGGRGIGLALCKKVIELHGSKIEAESDGERGATFKFTLPH
jgi:signal transduction histidine kinase